MKKAALPIFIISILLSVLCFYFYEDDLLLQKTQSQEAAVAVAGDTQAVDLATVATEPSGVTQAADESTAVVTTAPIVEISLPSSPSFATAVSDIANEAADAICEKYEAVGVQCAVVENGFVTGSYVYGMADVENGRAVTQNTKYRVASLSKLFTDMIFMRLADDGLADPDADISEYYGFDVRNPYYSDTVITTRMLMMHTSSVIDGRAFNEDLASYSEEPIDELLRSRSIYSSSRPGSSYVYSNLSNALVGSVSELASGRCFDDLAMEFFLNPLEIDGGYLASDIDNEEDIGLLYGGSSTLQSQLLSQFDRTLGQTIHLVQGNLTISASDYAQLICVLLNGGCAANGTRLLSEESVAEFLQVQFSDSVRNIGLGSFIYTDSYIGHTLFAHTGSAYGMYASYAFDPLTKDAVVVLTSGANYATDNQTGIYSICLALIHELFPQK